MAKRRGVTEFLQVFQGDAQIFFDAETDLLICLDDKGCILKTNPAFERCLGYTESSMLGKPITSLMFADDLHSTTNMPRLLHYGGGLVTVTMVDYRYKVTDEGKRWYLILRPGR